MARKRFYWKKQLKNGQWAMCWAFPNIRGEADYSLHVVGGTRFLCKDWATNWETSELWGKSDTIPECALEAGKFYASCVRFMTKVGVSVKLACPTKKHQRAYTSMFSKDGYVDDGLGGLIYHPGRQKYHYNYLVQRKKT